MECLEHLRAFYPPTTLGKGAVWLLYFGCGALMCVVTNLGLLGVVRGLVLSDFRVVNLLICLVDHAACCIAPSYFYHNPPASLLCTTPPLVPPILK